MAPKQLRKIGRLRRNNSMILKKPSKHVVLREYQHCVCVWIISKERGEEALPDLQVFWLIRYGKRLRRAHERCAQEERKEQPSSYFHDF